MSYEKRFFDKLNRGSASDNMSIGKIEEVLKIIQKEMEKYNGKIALDPFATGKTFRDKYIVVFSSSLNNNQHTSLRMFFYELKKKYSDRILYTQWDGSMKNYEIVFKK